MALARTCLMLACILFAAGCVTPTTRNPVGLTTGLTRDAALIGTWRDDEFRFDEGEVFHVVPVGTETMTAFCIHMPQKKDEAGSFSVYEFTTAMAGQNHFINARELHLAREHVQDADGWMPLFYTTKNGGRSLKLYHLDQTRIAKAIESGALKGQVEKHKDTNSDGSVSEIIDSIEITAEPAELDAFMAKPEAAGLFTLYKKYRKVE